MIIRIDVNDNDFATGVCEVLEKEEGFFLTDEYFSRKLQELYKANDEKSLKEYVECSKKRDEIKDYISNETKSKEEQEEIKKYVKLAIMDYIKKEYSKDLEYLEKSIEVTIPKSMEAKWENAEVIYYFPNTFSETKFLLF